MGNAFHSSPLEGAHLAEIPGVDLAVMAKLGEANIDTAEKLVGQFLVLGRDVGRMASWLRDVCEISALNASEIAQALEAKAAKIVVL